jgi:hypothetical protein
MDVLAAVKTRRGLGALGLGACVPLSRPVPGLRVAASRSDG